MDLDRRRTRGRFALACMAILTLAAPALADPQVELVKLAGGKRLSVTHPDRKPLGSVLLIPGGSTLLDFSDSGQPAGENVGNFVVRTEDRYVSGGFLAAFIDDPSGVGVKEAIAWLRAAAPPVFLVSTSRGTTVAATAAATLGDAGPDGVVLTSSINSGRGSVLDLPLQNIHVPVLAVANSGDTCEVSLPGGADAIAARIQPPSLAQTFVFNSTLKQGRPCGAMSPHGYLGIEPEVVTRIIGWLKDHIPGR